MNNPADTLAALSAELCALNQCTEPCETHRGWARRLVSVLAAHPTIPPSPQAATYSSKSVMKRVETLKGNNPYAAHPTPAPQAVVEQAARYGWQHASWDWEAVKGGLDRFNPTPSPAPQGGGEALSVDAIRRSIEDAMLTGTGVLRIEHVPIASVSFATPPAQQPGEVVTDEMVETAEKERVRSLNAITAYGSAGVEERHLMAMRAALTAALAPKEKGNG